MVGAPRPTFVEVSVAFVVTQSGSDPGVLTDHCVARLAGFKVPRLIVFVTELPQTVTGKAQRRRLRALAEERVREQLFKDRMAKI
ncbi:hypothetical protein ACFFIO_00725 [Citricoccus parietis]|uniref:AMP-binding enzyme C-terminal domain-containing protein n=1 Tax=Citricoccus parietis TaxID=592307 RepID=A0ABV6F1R1_9MICC|nr:hypothetical protein [Citricoccus sp. K5]